MTLSNNIEDRIKALEKRVNQIITDSITKSRLAYCSIRECPYCTHITMQSSIMLPTDNHSFHEGHTCLTCGKIWHKNPEKELIEYKLTRSKA